MKGVDVVNRLKKVIGKYTDDFSDIVTVSTLTRSGTTATAVTSAAHGLSTNDYVTIRGAKDPVTITSLTRDETIVTAVTTTAHKLIDPSKYDINQQNLQTVEISGADPSDYNGTHQLLTVADENTFTFKITTTPASPATTAGFVLQDDFDGYNGYKQVTVTDTTTFTYTVDSSLNTPAQGTIEVSTATRIAWSATAARAQQYYSGDADRVLQNWMFVVIGAKNIFKDGTIASDTDSATNKNEGYYYEAQQDLSLYVFIPSTNEVLGGGASDTARGSEKPILKSIANFDFGSVLTEGSYQPTIYIGNEESDYENAYYIHRFDFSAKGIICEADTTDIDPGVPLKLVDGLITDTGMELKPELR